MWKSWEHEHVLFHRASGLTHFINAASAALLRDVLAQPRTAEGAARELAAGQGARADETFLREVAALIRRLEVLGLVERVDA